MKSKTTLDYFASKRNCRRKRYCRTVKTTTSGNNVYLVNRSTRYITCIWMLWISIGIRTNSWDGNMFWIIRRNLSIVEFHPFWINFLGWATVITAISLNICFKSFQYFNIKYLLLFIFIKNHKRNNQDRHNHQNLMFKLIWILYFNCEYSPAAAAEKLVMIIRIFSFHSS